MNVTIRANQVSSATEDGSRIVAFGDSEARQGSEQAYFMLIRTLDSDEPVYIELGDQRFASHGGVETCVLGADSLLVDLNGEAGLKLGRSEPVRRIEVRFGGCEYDRAALSQALDRDLFQGHPCYREDQT